MRRFTPRGSWLWLVLATCLGSCGQLDVPEEDWAFLREYYRFRAEGELDSVMARYIPAAQDAPEMLQSWTRELEGIDERVGRIKTFQLVNKATQFRAANDEPLSAGRLLYVDYEFIVSTERGYGYRECIRLRPDTGPRFRIQNLQIQPLEEEDSEASADSNAEA